MKRNIRWTTVGCALILIAVFGIGGFFLGKSTEARQAQEDKDLSVLLNRSELEGLGEIDGPIYVTGHKSPDSDTVGSSIAYASLLRKLGYDAVPVVLGDVNHESALILDRAGVETPELLEDAAGKNMILVDHSEYIQSADGLEDANIISIIDHHGDGSVTTGNQLIYDARPLGSTATIIWIRYRNYGVAVDQETAAVMLGSILSDTRNLQSNTTTSADRAAVKELSGIAGISNTDDFYQDMYQELISYDGMTDEEIFFSDYKEYQIAGKNISVGCVSAYDEESAKDLAEQMRAVMPSALSSTGMDMAFAMIGILHDDIDVTYLIPSDDSANEVLAAAFGDTADFDGKAYRLEPGISRKKVFIPAITDVLEAYPKE